MALSNMRREPRREITETVVGLVILGIYLLFWYGVTLWARAHNFLNSAADKVFADLAFFIILGTAALLLAAGMLFLIAVAIHNTGETICNALARRGLELRPKQRYR